MYVRDARNRDEAWLLENIERMGLDEVAFRSRDYVIAVDEQTNEKAGFGRIRILKHEDGESCELTCLGTIERFRGQGVGAHVVERLVENASDQGFEVVYAFVEGPEPLVELGFERVDEADLPDGVVPRLAEKRETVAAEAVPLRLSVDRFTMPADRREAFKRAGAEAGEPEPEPEESPEDFGIDPETATYKYDTGR